jgi:hypothetical protein
MTDIQPGPFNTKALSENLIVLPSPPAYSAELEVAASKLALERGDFAKIEADHAKAVKLSYRLSTVENPPSREQLDSFYTVL